MFEATHTNDFVAVAVPAVGDDKTVSSQEGPAALLLENVFNPPKWYISSKSFPPDATAAVRRAPQQDAELLGSIASGAVLMVGGTSSHYLQCTLVDTLSTTSQEVGFVLQQLDGQPLFITADAPPHMLEHCFEPTRTFVCAASFPKTSSAAVRVAPTPHSELVTSLPYGSNVQATGSFGSYLQFWLDDPSVQGGSRFLWVPRVLGELVLFVEQGKNEESHMMNPGRVADVAISEEDVQINRSAEAAISEQDSQISRFQQWWAEGHGEAAAAAHAILSLVDRSVLQDVVSSGANYHNFLSADRLDGLQRLVDKSRKPGLEPLKRALLTKGGAKSQARAVGTVLFKEAMAIFTNPKPDKIDHQAELETDPSIAGTVEDSQREPMLDEIYNPPRRFVCSDAFPPDATVAVRAIPDMLGELLTTLQHGSEILATGSRNSYLQFKLEDAGEGGSRMVWVPRVLGDLVLFVEQKDMQPANVGQAASSLSAEAAISEQDSQISRFQQWWAEGHGEAAAAAHAILSLVDRSVLQDVVSSGANYHNFLSADRLDGLQRLVDKSRKPGLEPLKRALLTKGGAKSQARAVGTVLFKEAMAIFTNPKPDKIDHQAELETDPSIAGTVEDSQREPMLDEIYNPPRRFVCSDAFPPDATVAVRAIPDMLGELLTTLQHGSEILATGSRNSYLQFKLEDAGEGGSRMVWVPRVLGDLVLFVEQKDMQPANVGQAASGLSAEAAISEQDSQISRFQQWWAEGHGEAAAAAHAILSLVDRSVLQDVVSSGANYHNFLSADRLDGLQRLVDKSRKPGLEPLKRALLTKGGAKSQARAVGTVLFKEAMAIFTNPKPDKIDHQAELETDPSIAGTVEDSQREPMLDEIYNPPRRFACSNAFPPDATVAVRAGPSQESDFLTCLPFGVAPCSRSEGCGCMCCICVVLSRFDAH